MNKTYYIGLDVHKETIAMTDKGTDKALFHSVSARSSGVNWCSYTKPVFPEKDLYMIATPVSDGGRNSISAYILLSFASP